MARRAEDAYAVTLPAPERVVRTLAAGAVLVGAATAVTLALGGRTPAWLARLDASTEATVGTWYSAALLMVAGICALLIGAARRSGGAPWARQWLVVGAGLVLMSADEVGQVHEMVAGPTMDVVEATGLGGTPARAVAGLVAVGAVVLALVTFLPWARALGRRTQLLVAGAVGLYFGSALGLEIVARLLETVDAPAAISEQVLPAIEETGEMLGVVLLVAALLPLLPAVRGMRSARDVQLAADGRAADPRPHDRTQAAA